MKPDRNVVDHAFSSFNPRLRHFVMFFTSTGPRQRGVVRKEGVMLAPRFPECQRGREPCHQDGGQGSNRGSWMAFTRSAQDGRRRARASEQNRIALRPASSPWATVSGERDAEWRARGGALGPGLDPPRERPPPLGLLGGPVGGLPA